MGHTNDDEFHRYEDAYGPTSATTLFYDIVAVSIFIIMSWVFLFPVNTVIPLDRRSISMLCATLTYVTRSFLFPHRSMNIVGAIDWEVLCLLAAIMVVNYVVIHLAETKRLVSYIQNQIKENPRRGFWLISLTTFLVAPFLTNDGVCLLFVEVILDAFNDVKTDGNENANASENENLGENSARQLCLEDGSPHATDVPGGESNANLDSSTNKNRGQEHVSLLAPTHNTSDQTSKAKVPLEAGDAMYFLLSLACSSNIGSSLTYTGNPQNMIIAGDAIDVLSPLKFLGYMLIPAIVSWIMTTMWIERCWMDSKSRQERAKLMKEMQGGITESIFQRRRLKFQWVKNKPASNDAIEQQQSQVGDVGGTPVLVSPMSASTSEAGSHTPPVHAGNHLDVTTGNSTALRQHTHTHTHTRGDSILGRRSGPISLTPCGTLSITLENVEQQQYSPNPSMDPALSSPLSPRRRRVKERDQAIKKIVRIISSPVPYMCVALLLIMIVMIFVDVMSISGLVCVTAIVMVSFTAIGTHWRGLPIFQEIGGGGGSDSPLTREERMESLQAFFSEVFDAIDWGLLVIFLGTFIVVANIDSTGIPKRFWQAIVGSKPFDTVVSVVGISTFVLIASQLLGNVAIIQLAVPNVTVLPDTQKRYAWAVLSFVATVGGNLLITGSAANIIVVEKAARLGGEQIDFFKHFRVCFWVTLLSCSLGAGVITFISGFESLTAGASS